MIVSSYNCLLLKVEIGSCSGSVVPTISVEFGAPHILSVPEAATTVLCTPDDGRDGCPKHVRVI